MAWDQKGARIAPAIDQANPVLPWPEPWAQAGPAVSAWGLHRAPV